jgi:hypothetical protein
VSDTHLAGPVQLPVCPDCDSPLVWPLGKSTPLCLDPRHTHTWWTQFLFVLGVLAVLAFYAASRCP